MLMTEPNEDLLMEYVKGILESIDFWAQCRFDTGYKVRPGYITLANLIIAMTMHKKGGLDKSQFIDICNEMWNKYDMRDY